MRTTLGAFSQLKCSSKRQTDGAPDSPKLVNPREQLAEALMSKAFQYPFCVNPSLSVCDHNCRTTDLKIPQHSAFINGFEIIFRIVILWLFVYIIQRTHLTKHPNYIIHLPCEHKVFKTILRHIIAHGKVLNWLHAPSVSIIY